MNESSNNPPKSSEVFVIPLGSKHRENADKFQHKVSEAKNTPTSAAQNYADVMERIRSHERRLQVLEESSSFRR